MYQDPLSKCNPNPNEILSKNSNQKSFLKLTEQIGLCGTQISPPTLLSFLLVFLFCHMLVRRICHFELRHYDDIVPNDEPVSSNVSFVKFSTWARTLNHDEEISIDCNQSLLIQE